MIALSKVRVGLFSGAGVAPLPAASAGAQTISDVLRIH